jgi:S-methylmethionine-dependent homocysteine/selenocysteine methylase
MSVEKAFEDNKKIFSLFETLRVKPKSVFLLDGGTGEELFKHGIPNDRKIWSAVALVEPEYHHILQRVHQSFVKAGSRAVTTNSYGVTPGVGFSEEEIEKYCKIAGELAKNAVGVKALVFGSLPPLIESYRADLIMNHCDGVRVYRKLASALLPFVDAFLTETISCTEESFQVIEAVHDLRKPLLVSYTVNSKGDLRGGETVVEVIPRLLEFCSRYGVRCKLSCVECCLFLNKLVLEKRLLTYIDSQYLPYFLIVLNLKLSLRRWKKFKQTKRFPIYFTIRALS